MYRPRKENATKSSQTQTRAGEDKGTTEKEVSNKHGSFGTATRHNGGSRICLGAVQGTDNRRGRRNADIRTIR